MKKQITFILSILMLSVLLVGCGKGNKSLPDTWYSTRPDTITFKTKDTYTSQWLTMGREGDYIKKGNTYILTNIEGKPHKFELIEDEGKKTLYYKSETSDLTYTYYATEEEVNKIIAEEKEKAEREAEEKKQKDLEELKTILIGTWQCITIDKSIIEFTSDGEYKFTDTKDNVWKYEIVDFETLKITRDNGESYNEKAEIEKTENGYELSLSLRGYEKK